MFRNERVWHAGIVLFYAPEQNKDIRAGVLDINDMRDTGFVNVRLISKAAFVLPKEAENWETHKKKEASKKLAKPLSKGDMICFEVYEHAHGGEIVSFERIRPYIASRVEDKELQIKLAGIINPKDPSLFYSDEFRAIKIPAEFQSKTMANVYLWAWIELKLDDNYNLEHSFYAFDGLCDLATQMSVGSVPWNVGHTRYEIVQFGDADDEEIERNEGKEKLPPLELKGVFAYMTGESSFLLKNFPQYKCVMPFKRTEEWLNIGQFYSVDCIWNSFEKFYMIQNILQKKGPEKLSVDPNFNELRCNVKAHETILGLFYNQTFGYLSDFHDVLSLLHLTSLKTNSIQVTFTDPGPSRSGQIRYSVSKITGDKLLKFEKILAEQEIVVTKVKGIVIDHESAYSAKHNLFFLFDKKEIPPPVGKRINFEAKYDHQNKKFIISSWSEIRGEDVRFERKKMIENRPLERQCIFQTSAKIVPQRELNNILFSEDFSLLDDNLELMELEENNQTKIYDIWVKRAEFDDCSSYEPRTKFHIIGVGKETPRDRVAEEPLTEQERVQRQQFEDLIRRNQMTAVGPLVGSRFAGPGTVKPAEEVLRNEDREDPSAPIPTSNSLFGKTKIIPQEKKPKVFEGAWGLAKNEPLPPQKELQNLQITAETSSRFSAPSKKDQQLVSRQPGNNAAASSQRTTQQMGSYLSREQFSDDDYNTTEDGRMDVSITPSSGQHTTAKKEFPLEIRAEPIQGQTRTASRFSDPKRGLIQSQEENATQKEEFHLPTQNSKQQTASRFSAPSSKHQEAVDREQQSGSNAPPQERNQTSSRFSGRSHDPTFKQQDMPSQEAMTQNYQTNPTSSRFAGPSLPPKYQQKQRQSTVYYDLNQQQSVPSQFNVPRYQEPQYYQRERENYSPSSCSSSNSNEAREFSMELRGRQHVKPYNGVVLAPKDSPFKYDVVETLTRLKHHYPMSTKKEQYIKEIAKLLVEKKGFWDEANTRYPHIARNLCEILGIEN